MPRRREPTGDDKYIKPSSIVARDDPPTLSALMMKIPTIIHALNKSFVKLAEPEPDWSLYRAEIRNGNPFIVRDMCDRCGKVFIYPRWRKIRAYKDPTLGTVYFETGICKDCINASVYVDKYLDGDPLGEVQAKKLFYSYAVEYERAWRLVLAAAPTILLTEAAWQKACKFFNGCAFCGGPIEVRAKYFPTYLNGAHTPWNVIPLCGDCMRQHYAGRTTKGKKVRRYKVFSTPSQFNKAKTTRMYLLEQMRIYGIYMEPLIPFMERFYETKTLEGAR